MSTKKNKVESVQLKPEHSIKSQFNNLYGITLEIEEHQKNLSFMCASITGEKTPFHEYDGEHEDNLLSTLTCLVTNLSLFSESMRESIKKIEEQLPA